MLIRHVSQVGIRFTCVVVLSSSTSPDLPYRLHYKSWFSKLDELWVNERCTEAVDITGTWSVWVEWGWGVDTFQIGHGRGMSVFMYVQASCVG